MPWRNRPIFNYENSCKSSCIFVLEIPVKVPIFFFEGAKTTGSITVDHCYTSSLPHPVTSAVDELATTTVKSVGT